jgi:hypothetical protein
VFIIYVYFYNKCIKNCQLKNTATKKKLKLKKKIIKIFFIAVGTSANMLLIFAVPGGATAKPSKYFLRVAYNSVPTALRSLAGPRLFVSGPKKYIKGSLSSAQVCFSKPAKPSIFAQVLLILKIFCLFYFDGHFLY